MGRILGLDYGQRRVGVALSDPMGITAQPLVTLDFHDAEKAWQKLSDIIFQQKVEKIVIGLPLTLKGSKGSKARETEKFIATLQKRFDLPVVVWDERLTTVAAQRSLREMGQSPGRNKEKLDQLSAVFILQGYLNSRPQNNNSHQLSKGEVVLE
ncbi:MAG: Holliday junction resolvase RuvX [candidate division KSB1 bacterium]|nr:Holliday junction resolvase RuvX [candidate division KSB1 bacterium]